MDDRLDDRELSTLLSDAVSDVEPADRLDEIRALTSPRRARTGWYAAGGAMLAVAAAVTAMAVLADQRPSSDGAGPAGPPTSAGDPSGAARYPVYYFGDTPEGTRLFREFQQKYGAGGSLAVASQLVGSPPEDPDYRTLWPRDSFTGAQVTTVEGQRVIRVDVGNVARDRPRGLSRADAELALQQVVYTMQAVAQDETLPVQFFFGPGPTDSLIGIDVSEPLDTAPQLDVLSHMSISDPAEGLRVSGAFTARGRANGFEGSVSCSLAPSAGGEAVWTEATIAGTYEEHLFPWELEVDLAGVPADTYTFSCSTDDPTGGAEGIGAFVDTRTVVVE